MENELRTELEKLNGNLNRIFDRIGDLDQDVKNLASDVKDIKASVAEQGEKIATIKADTDHNKNEIEKIWQQFPKNKDDLKEYIKIVVRDAISNQKVWFYGMTGTALISVLFVLIREYIK